MDDLGLLLDQLPLPQIPDSVSATDRALILLFLESGKQQMRPFSGRYEAPWLLTPFTSDIWQTTNRGREELINGSWRNAVSIDWRVLLPNGKFLTDPAYESLLTCPKKLAFFARSTLISGPSSPIAWCTSTYRLIGLGRWVVLNEERFQPSRYGFKLIDQASVEWLFSLYATGGSTSAMYIPQRIVKLLYRESTRADCPQAVLDMPLEIPALDIPPIVEWLKKNGAYRTIVLGTNTGRHCVAREWLAARISENVGSLSSLSIARLLRKFEPDFASDQLLVPLHQETELPSQYAESATSDNIPASEKSLKALAGLLSSLLEAHRHIPDLLPEPSQISISRASKLAAKVTKPSGHTPFMPVNTGLQYLNVAMRFVTVYGKAIVGLYLAALPSRKMRNRELNTYLKRHGNDWKLEDGRTIVSVLNITEFKRQDGNPDFATFRSNPTLDDALRVLIGACTVCIALLKPSREEELLLLDRNCLRHYAGGYWLNFDLGKSNVNGVEAWQELDRPIPVVSARAVELLQQLGTGLLGKFGNERKFSNNLFFLPKANGFGPVTPHKDLLPDHLDIFCDYVGLPPDEEGRRWYVRVHEMRKWFLLLLFWSGRFDVLDAARWIAGHTDAQHVYAYIEREFPGEELPNIEAQYAIDRIYKLDTLRARAAVESDLDADGSKALYERVLQHFNVETLSMVPESDWMAYVLSMREADLFHLEPHSIFGAGKDEIVGINVSFVLRERS
jgi:hypothetical protein